MAEHEKGAGEARLHRRTFLQAAGGVTAVAATLAGAEEASAQNKDVRTSKARYRESEHVKSHYRTSRY